MLTRNWLMPKKASIPSSGSRERRRSVANNRLYLVVPSDEEDGREYQVLLAKGFSGEWQVWEPETLAERITDALEKANPMESDVPGVKTAIYVEAENHAYITKPRTTVCFGDKMEIVKKRNAT